MKGTMEPLGEEELPHRGAMRWVTGARLREEDDGAEARVEVGEGHPFLCAGGGLMRSALIEVMAQGAAAASALRVRATGRRIKAGCLVGVREFEVFCDVGVGELLVRSWPERGFGNLSLVRLEVVDAGGKRVAAGRMTFHLEIE
jgi:predicted hotdog family 3-hydroxylacyl-ACP dehydratase